MINKEKVKNNTYKLEGPNGIFPALLQRYLAVNLSRTKNKVDEEYVER